MSSSSRQRRKRKTQLRLLLAGSAIAVIGILFAMLVSSLANRTPAPVSDGVASYYESNKALSEPTESAKAPAVAYLGDSWTSNGKDVGVPAFASKEFGWTSYPFGQGGTGYLNPGPVENGVLPFSSRVDKVVAAQPDVVFILGGLNDRGRDYATDEAMTAAAGSLYDSLAQKLPAAQLVVVGPYYPGDQVPGDLLTIRDLFKQQAAKRGIPFIDPIAGKWITGTPDVPGSGNAPGFIANNHPNEAGMRHLADQLAKAVKAEPKLAKFL